MKFNKTLNTTGQGLYSDRAAAVDCEAIELLKVDQQFGELRIYFTSTSWNVQRHGLIYTDKGFMQGLRIALHKMGLEGSDVEYSEAGMQGDDFVSCDVGERFIAGWDMLEKQCKKCSIKHLSYYILHDKILCESCYEGIDVE